jgi:tetratricopeptide (TPR) repeat protein
LQQTDLASTYLWRAFHKAPTHLPSQLAALSYAIEHNTWLSQSSNIRKRIEQLINKRQYTNASKAQWLVLQAREFWRNRQTDAAIHSIEQATTLDSENRYHRWLQIQFHLWSYQPHIARQLITRERKYADHPQLVIWDFEAMKQYATAENLLKYLEGFSEYDPKQPQRQYLYYYLLALHYVAQDAKPAAIASCERALTMADVQISPPFAHLLMLKLLIETRQFKKAIQQLKNMPPDTPPHQLLFLQGQLQIAQKQYKEAENTAIQIQKQYPIYYQGHLLQAELRVAQNQINPALSAYRKALLFHHQRPSLLLIPMVKLYIDSKEYREALRLIERYENAKKGELSCSLLLHKLTALFQLKQCSQLLSLEIKHCSHFQFHFLRGQCAIQNNSTEQALSELQKANRLAPRLLEPLEAIADLYYNTKQYNEAVKAYRQLLDRNPRNKLYVLRISHIYRHRQLYPKALQLLQRYVPASSADIDLNLERARILVALSQHGPALRTYGNLSKIKLSQAQRVELLIGHANLLLQQKKYAVALKLYSEALSLNPQNLDALFAQIRVFFHLQQFKACVDTATKYLSSASPDVTNRPQVTLLLNTCRTRLKNPAP